MDEILRQLFQALLSLLVLLVIFGLRHLQAYLLEKLGAAEYERTMKRLELLQSIALSVVAAVEQTRGDDDNETLKSRALKLMRDQLNNIGIHYELEELDTLIEDAVQKINLFGSRKS